MRVTLLCAIAAILGACASAQPAASSSSLRPRLQSRAAVAALDEVFSDRGVELAPLLVDPSRLQLGDVFELEWASDPRLSPDGRRIVYVRHGMDIMKDQRRASLWIIDREGTNHRPVAAGEASYSRPRWSPTGDRLLFVAASAGEAQLYVRWMDTGQVAKITHVRRPPKHVVWSPDGTEIAFTMHVPQESEPLVKLPKPPEGASWAEPPRIIDKVVYRNDGSGYVEEGYTHLFVVPADGGTPHQLTSGSFHHDSEPAWMPDGQSILVSANRHDNWEHDPVNTEIYEVHVVTGAIRALTDRRGADEDPVVSPDGRRIAYVGFDDKRLPYHIRQLYLMDRRGGGVRSLTADLDRSVDQATWSSDGKGLYISYDDRGNTKIAYVALAGKRRVLAHHGGGQSIGRPYSSGSFTVARDGSVAFTVTRPDHPADVAIGGPGLREPRRLTALNQDLFSTKALAELEELWVDSSHDRRPVHAWILKPPGFDPSEKYPLILEIHGGPFANYGDRFAAECQWYAAAGYVVLYVNPRGSTSYGEEFASLIFNAYPGNDYDDLMSAVDAVVARGYIDEKRLYVTGGSGGGVLTSWIIGKTNRFRAAVVAKPVINWYSFVLTADHANYFARYWFTAMPWETPQPYLERSPLSLVGNVTTPTMIITGEADYRTPISESEQYYQALKLRGVKSVLVRVPGASHHIAERPSQLVAKVGHVLAWFEMHRDAAATPEPPRSAPAGSANAPTADR